MTIDYQGNWLADLKNSLSTLKKPSTEDLPPKRPLVRTHPSRLQEAYIAAACHMHQLLCKEDTNILYELNNTILINWNYATCGIMPKFVMVDDKNHHRQVLKIRVKDYLWPTKPDKWFTVHEMPGQLMPNLRLRPYMTHPSWNYGLVWKLRCTYIEAIQRHTSKIAFMKNPQFAAALQDAQREFGWIRHQIKELKLGSLDEQHQSVRDGGAQGF